MFERILVPLDGSSLAEQALPVAARLARATGGSLILMQVAVLPIVERPEMTPAQEYSQRVLDEAYLSAADYLEQITLRSELIGVRCETQVLSGDIAETILSLAHSLHVDIIVMSSHGYTGRKRWSLGSVAQKVSRHSPVPVLVLREGGAVSAQALHSATAVSVLVPLDGSERAEAAIEPAAQLAAALADHRQAKLHLLRVVAIPSTSGKFRGQAHIDFDVAVREQAQQDAEIYMQSILSRFVEARLAALSLTVSTEVVVNEDVAQAIIQEAEHDMQGGEATGHELGFIAMATHGRGGLARWALGSMTERVLEACKIPLFIVRPHHEKARHPQTSGESGAAANGEASRRAVPRDVMEEEAIMIIEETSRESWQ